jgi:hypothetical protein
MDSPTTLRVYRRPAFLRERHMPSELVVQGTVEIRVHMTGALWFAEVEAQGSDHLRVRLRTGELGALPSLAEGMAVDCAMESADGRYCVEAHVLRQDGALLWLTIAPVWIRAENRQSPRMTGGFTVAYTAGEASGIAACLDISAGGMRLRMANPLPLRSSVGLSFTLPGEPQPVDLDGTVLYVHSLEDDTPGVDVGVKFRHVPVADGARIARFCHF